MTTQTLDADQIVRRARPITGQHVTLDLNPFDSLREEQRRH